MRRAALLLAILAAAAVPAAASHIRFGDPALPELVECGEEPFALAQLRSERFAERRFNGAAAAMRRFLRSEARLAGEFPRRGYRELLRTRKVVIFGVGHPPRLATFRVERERSGWDVNQFGGCRLRPAPEGGALAADWKLDPSAPRPGPQSTEIPILVNEVECASGEPATGRIAEPRVFLDARRAVVTIFVRPVEGGAECPGNPDTPYVLRLAEPLGERALLDAGKVPARRRFAP